MSKHNLIQKFLCIKTWKGNGARAPHKPLLLLLVLAKLYNGESKFYYQDIAEDLTSLLQNFGPPRRTYHPQYPFWRLQNDGIWNVKTSNSIQENISGDVPVKALITNKAYGQFAPDIEEHLLLSKEITGNIIKNLLEKNFPDTIHEDILQAIGFDLENKLQLEKRKRSPYFRENVLRAYGYRCAICGFDVRMGHYPVALEAAHIKWHVAGGPDIEENGLALCSLHHKLFDRGAFTISKQLEIVVSDRANGTLGFTEWLMQYHGARVGHPQSTKYVPNNNYLVWHTNEVFQGDKRELGYA